MDGQSSDTPMAEGGNGRRGQPKKKKRKAKSKPGPKSKKSHVNPRRPGETY